MDDKTMKSEMPASCKYLLSLYASISAVEEFLKTDKLPSGPIVLYDDRGSFIVTEPDWTFLLPEACHDLGTNCNLDSEQLDRLNTFIAMKEFKMTELGFSQAYQISLDTNIPTEHDPQMDEAEG